jgi:hypothetical protein
VTVSSAVLNVPKALSANCVKDFLFVANVASFC